MGNAPYIITDVITNFIPDIILDIKPDTFTGIVLGAAPDVVPGITDINSDIMPYIPINIISDIFHNICSQ